MVNPLDLIDTFVILILENRSFDHAAGYLSLPGPSHLPVDGLRDDPAWLASHASTYNGRSYPPFAMTEEAIPDPPHEFATISMQLGRRGPPGATRPMDGFVRSYMARKPPPPDPSLVMGYYTAADVPIFDFFAHNFTICDHWFAALPTGTQPNRLMAMSGKTSVMDNADLFLPYQDLVYDWLDEHRVRWCAYQSGDFLPFFTLMTAWLPEIATSLALDPKQGQGRFRRLFNLLSDWRNNQTMPQVIFIEPEYTDGPNSSPNNDHPPTPISRGQILLRDVYNILVSNPCRWSRTMMIVTYDEHGGFFDHVPPLPIRTEVRTAHGFQVLVDSTGVRVPAFVISPLVEPGTVYASPLDHTSILQLLADKFDPGQAYSDAVQKRQSQLSPLSSALTRSTPRADFPAPLSTLVAAPAAPAAAGPLAPGASANGRALQRAAEKMLRDHPELTNQSLKPIAMAVRKGSAKQ